MRDTGRDSLSFTRAAAKSGVEEDFFFEYLFWQK